MKYLLDTCVLLWSLDGNRSKLSEFIDIIEEENNYIFVSIVSYWEIIIKKSLGKIKIPADFLEFIEKTGFSWLNLELRHITQLDQLPLLHPDPFDRLLIAQARSEALTLLTPDEKILQYLRPS